VKRCKCYRTFSVNIQLQIQTERSRYVSHYTQHNVWGGNLLKILSENVIEGHQYPNVKIQGDGFLDKDCIWGTTADEPKNLNFTLSKDKTTEMRKRTLQFQIVIQNVYRFLEKPGFLHLLFDVRFKLMWKKIRPHDLAYFIFESVRKTQ